MSWEAEKHEVLVIISERSKFEFRRFREEGLGKY